MTAQIEHDNGYANNGYANNNTPAANYLDGKMESHDDALRRVRTAGAISMSPELFEKLYLSPQTTVKGDLRKTFGNPTPIALIGFLICLTPLACQLMGWRGSGGSGIATVGAIWFMGGLLLLIGGLLEWILGNTFPAVVFASFGGFYFAFAATLTESFGAFAAYAPAGEPAAAGQAARGFNAGFGFFMLWMGVMCLIYLICALRTNICFVVIFLTLMLAFCCLTGAYWALGNDYAGNAAYAGKLIVAAGAFLFVTCLSGWWIFFAIMLEALDFPFQVPVGDLSTLIVGRKARQQTKSEV